jgi:hypothetical protein
MPSHSTKKHKRGASPAQRRWQHVRKEGYLSESLVKMRRALENWETTHMKPVVREEERPIRSRSYGSDGGAGSSSASSARPRTEDTNFLGYTEEQVVNARNRVLSDHCAYSNREKGCKGNNTMSCRIYDLGYCNGNKGLKGDTWRDPNLIRGLKANDYLV